jgi:CO/xanthine dehydrogenase Mo-binding subunit
MILEAEATLDADGRIDSWRYEIWSDTHSTRPGGNPGSLLAARYVDDAHPLTSRGYLGGGYRNAPPYYTIPNVRIDAHFFEGPLRVSALRSLGAYANVFAIESFMDELADRAEADPLDFRLRHLDDPRARDVIRRVGAMTADEPLGEGEGMGYGYARYKNSASYCAVAAKVRADASGALQIEKMWSAIDAGEVINPDGLRNQTEGGMIQSASWTMGEAVQFDAEHVTSLDWQRYPIFRFEDVPDVEVAIIDRPEEAPLGAGEAAQGPAAAAIANAIYRATGQRIRDLPIRTA